MSDTPFPAGAAPDGAAPMAAQRPTPAPTARCARPTPRGGGARGRRPAMTRRTRAAARRADPDPDAQPGAVPGARRAADRRARHLRRAAQAAARQERRVGIVLQRSPETEQPGAADLHEVGTEASVLRYLTTPDGTHHVVTRGERRFRIRELLPGYGHLVARVDYLEPAIGEDAESSRPRLRRGRRRRRDRARGADAPAARSAWPRC